MNEKLSVMENRMLGNFQKRMIVEVVGHRDEKVVQWPDLAVSDLLEKAEYHLYKAKIAYLAERFGEAKKHFAHTANLLAMTYDNLSRIEERRSP